MTATHIPSDAGFSDSVLSSQQTFRHVLTAMSHPGQAAGPLSMVSSPKSMNPTVAALCLTLCDEDAPIWLAGSLSCEAVRLYLSFHTGAPFTQRAGDASFAVTDDLVGLDFSTLNVGTTSYPDRSTTVIAQVDSLSGGPSVVLSGPGVNGERPCELPTLPPSFLIDWMERRHLFPCGIDLLFAAPTGVLALPRTVSIQEA